jgi:hypothetical protein
MKSKIKGESLRADSPRDDQLFQQRSVVYVKTEVLRHNTNGVMKAETLPSMGVAGKYGQTFNQRS